MCTGRSWAGAVGADPGANPARAQNPGSPEPGGAAAGWGAPSALWGSQVKDVEAKKWSSGSQAPGARCARVGCACVYLRVEGTGAPRLLRYCET